MDSHLVEVELLDELVELAEEAVEHGGDLHGRDLIAERGKAHNVGEEDGDHVLLLDLRLDAILESFSNVLGKHLVRATCRFCSRTLKKHYLAYLLQNTVLPSSFHATAQEGFTN